jgi:hypothetical protein
LVMASLALSSRDAATTTEPTLSHLKDSFGRGRHQVRLCLTLNGRTGGCHGYNWKTGHLMSQPLSVYL